MGSPEWLDQIISRLDALPGRFALAIATWIGEEPGPIDGLLNQIREALGGHATNFVSVDSESLPETHAWCRPDSPAAGERALKVPVALAGRPLGVLTVGLPEGPGAWPVEIEERLHALAALMGFAMRHTRQARELEQARAEIACLTTYPAVWCEDTANAGEPYDIIGDSPLLRVALARVQEVAATDASVVLLGETGTGKELFARAVHRRSIRRDRPFVRVNCAALPPTLIESELFGHERGAFTGAVATRQGRFELAHKGTIFLDEIGDLPTEVQAKLLRVLQEGEFERVGSSQSRKVDVRVVAATHHNLEAAVSEGRFRSDLYYRLNVFPIALPPLRDRLDDIPRLVWFFINQRQRALGRRFTKIPPSVFAALQQHSWPGNVRELHNVIERAMIHSSGDTLRLDDGPGLVSSRSVHDDSTLEAVERRHIEQALRRCQWRINGAGNAAEMLGLHPNTLRFRLKKLGLRRPTTQTNIRPVNRLSA
jgi:formate hydrogenlyase transcriptional activator